MHSYGLTLVTLSFLLKTQAHLDAIFPALCFSSVEETSDSLRLSLTSSYLLYWEETSLASPVVGAGAAEWS